MFRSFRWEAAQIPKVKVVRLDSNKRTSEQTAYMPSIPEIPKCPQNLLPSKDWENVFLADFSELRRVSSAIQSFCLMLWATVHHHCHHENSFLKVGSFIKLMFKLDRPYKDQPILFNRLKPWHKLYTNWPQILGQTSMVKEVLSIKSEGQIGIWKPIIT